MTLSIAARFPAVASALVIFMFTRLVSAQSRVPNFNSQATSAFVWGEDALTGAVSRTIKEPISGNEIRKIGHEGIELSSQARFELAGLGQSGELLSFTTTIVNSTNSELSVTQAGASVDGYFALPFPIERAKHFSNAGHDHDRERANLNCLTGGFPTEELLSTSNIAPTNAVVSPGSAITISFVSKDPRNYSILCSIAGCYPKGAIRFFVRVNATDFVLYGADETWLTVLTDW